MNSTKPKHAKFAMHHSVREAADASRRHLVTPDQEMTDAVIDVVVARPVGDQALASRSASKIGSSTSLAAVCTTRSLIVGIPSGRSPLPPGFGIITRRTGAGRYVFLIRSFLIADSPSSSPSASIIPNVAPSTSGAPLFARARS